MAGDYSAIGYANLVNIIITLVCIGFSWWIIQSVRLDLFVKNPNSFQYKALQIILSIIIGYELGRFFIDYAHWSSMLRWLFETSS